eukprot:CAMPEP_0175165742 /NCGR_PEP_ID=MMETSP0087-20121206/27271_1 /TAXON_ID=136419 /ORGANISM="Unknown Unknown, Strain D1" /LENGTH=41 /DNA_ID= /DNA_START= /DNA_END= /DNA_ORIENTATION=
MPVETETESEKGAATGAKKREGRTQPSTTHMGVASPGTEQM